MSIRNVLGWVIGLPVGFFVLIVVIGVIGGRNESSNSMPAPTAAAPPDGQAEVPQVANIVATSPGRLKPEDIIIFPESSIVCMTRSQLGEVMASGLRGEQTKVRALVAGPANRNAPCMMVSPTQRLKVISVDYPDSSGQAIGVIEIVGEQIVSAKGVWALSTGALVVP